jgi:hypothetical protein
MAMVWRVEDVQCVSDEGYMSHVWAERHRGRERRREGADCTDPRISRRMAAAILFPFVEDESDGDGRVKIEKNARDYVLF